MILGIMDFVDAIRALIGGPVELPHLLLAMLVIVALLVAERYYHEDE
jgi:hypothetical protein